MSGLRPIGHALICLLCLLSLLACGGGGSSAAPGQPQFLGFTATGEHDPIRLEPGGATVQLDIPQPAGSAKAADFLTIDWDDDSPIEFIDLSAVSEWPLALTHLYRAAGSKLIALDLRVGAAIIAHGEQRISILPNLGPVLCGTITPTPAEGLIQGPEPLEVRIDATCTDDPDPFFTKAITFDVDYGDGEVLTGVTAAELSARTKIYAGGGYQLRITAFDLEGQPSVLEFVVAVVTNSPPEIHLETVPALVNSVIAFPKSMAASTIALDLTRSTDQETYLPDAGLISIDWGDGSVPFVDAPFLDIAVVIHQYQTPGTFPLVLSLSDGDHTVTQEITVEKPDPIPPIACWSLQPPPIDGVIHGTSPFMLTVDPRCSSDANSELLKTGQYRIFTSSWRSFNLLDEPVTKIFENAFQGEVTLQVRDNEGFTAIPLTISLDIAQGPEFVPVVCGTWDPPANEFGVVTGTPPFSPELNLNCSSDADSDLLATGKISVVFGDGPQLVNEPFATYAESIKKPYSQEGIYTHIVTLTDKRGNESEPFITVINVLPPPVNQLPVAIIGTDTTGGAAPWTVQFSSADSYDPDGSLISTIWNFGDPDYPQGGVNILPNPSHTFANPASYLVQLLVIDDSGYGNPLDRDIATTTIEVTP